MRVKFLFISVLFSVFCVQAQNHYIRGKVIDSESNSPLTGVEIIVSSKTVVFNARTDIQGIFTIENLIRGTYEVIISKIGYDSFVSRIQLTDTEFFKDLGTLELKPSSIQNAMAAMEVMEIDLDNDVELEQVSSILRSSRDIFSNATSYTFSPMRFRSRGLNNNYSDVYLSGLRVNDMVNGHVLWSLWGGLNDATRNQEVALGTNPSGFSFGGMGGTTNIITRASAYRPGTRVTVSNSNRTYSNRLMFIYSTGLMQNGWAFTVSGSRRWGDNSYVQGMFYDAWAGFFSAEKHLNDHHSIGLTAIASPVKRGVSNGSTQEVYDLVGHNYYNANIGWQNDKRRNSRVRESLEPILILNHYWKINDEAKLTTSLGYRFGYNGYSALNWYDAPDPRPDYYRYLPSYHVDEAGNHLESFDYVTELWKSDRTIRYINWDRLYNVNYNSNADYYSEDGTLLASGKRSKYIIEDRRTDQRGINWSSVLNTTLSKNLKMDAGINIRFNKTMNFKTIKDLLGGDYWVDIDQFAERDFPDRDAIQNDLDNPDRIVRKGDRYGYSYDAHVKDFGIWSVLNGSWNKIDAYVGFKFGYNTFYRKGNYRKGLFPDNSYGDSEKYDFWAYGVKLGATYKISGRHYILGNFAFVQNPPYFRNVFVSPRTRNSVITNMNSEKMLSADLSYEIRTPLIKGRLTGYVTSVNDQTKIMSFYDDHYRSFGNYVMTGIDQRHLGIELGAEVKISPSFSMQGVLALGEFFYTSNPNYEQTVDNTNKVLESDKVYWKNFYVSGTPQTAATLGLRYNDPKYWYVGINGNYFGRNYIDMNPVLRTDKARMQLDKQYIDQEKFGDGFTLDAFCGTSIRINRRYYLGISLNVSNILNHESLKSGGYEQLRVAQDKATNTMKKPFDSRYFYMYGTTYFLNVNFRF